LSGDCGIDEACMADKLNLIMRVATATPGMQAESVEFERLIERVRACTICEARLPNAPRPVLRAAPSARVLIVGQAPGRRVHESGIPWNDPSGDLLRAWLRIDREDFYDERRIAIIPAGLCYPGTGESGDLPPRPECAPHWHPKLRAMLPHIRLTLLVGGYAQAYYLGAGRKKTLAETVRAREEYLPEFFPLPHPSPRNRLWLKKNDWFEREALPQLRRRFRAALGDRKPK
jgi:uracil-DNA glycosylase